MKSTDLKPLIRAYTGLNEADQAQVCFEAAYIWLEKVLETDQYGLDMLPLQPGFWTWWTRNWELIDQAFVDAIMIQPDGIAIIQLPGKSFQVWTSIRDERQARSIWARYHDPQYVQSNQELIRASFHQYVKTLVTGKSA